MYSTCTQTHTVGSKSLRLLVKIVLFAFNDSGAQTDMFKQMSADASGSYIYANCAIVH